LNYRQYKPCKRRPPSDILDGKVLRDQLDPLRERVCDRDTYHLKVAVQIKTNSARGAAFMVLAMFQAEVINLMMDLQREKKLSYLFIAHGLAVVEHISHRVAVMYLGKIVEYAEKKRLFLNPLHPYTEALLAAVPVPNPKLRRAKRPLAGDVPSPVNPPPGCPFHTRCGYAQDRCRLEVPQLREVAPGHWVSCHFR